MTQNALPEPDDDDDRSILGDIQEVGWSVLYIEDETDDDSPNFGFSVGIFHSLGHPEILLMGMPEEDTSAMINLIGDAIRDGQRFEAGSTFDAIPTLPLRFVTMDESHYEDYVGYDLWFYQGRPFPILQAVWPDDEKRYPWEPGYDEALRQFQTLLGEPGQ
jgi:hypothetical protein